MLTIWIWGFKFSKINTKFSFFASRIFGKISSRKKSIKLLFKNPQNITIQIEGEVCKIKKVKTVEATFRFEKNNRGFIK